MKILVLGGTAFLGRAFVESAIDKGHSLTLFNRGQRNAEIFSDIEQIHGDRSVDLSALDGRKWDAVYDTSGYVPRVVGMAAEALKDSVGRYLFISSISVFKHLNVLNQAEDAEVARLEDESVEQITGETYGGLKVLCEETVQKAFSDHAVIVRPGLIVGPTDYTDRFTYWPVRMERGGDVLVPDVKSQPVQIIDVRDLASWCVELLEQDASGVYNATGTQQPYTLEGVLTECAKHTSAEFVWVAPEFLKEREVSPWSDLPLALDYDGTSNGMCQIDVSKAIHAGLKLRPLRETILDTRAWAKTRPTEYSWRAGLTAEREDEVLSAWNATKLT